LRRADVIGWLRVWFETAIPIARRNIKLGSCRL
jgi:hypothetical protein